MSGEPTKLNGNILIPKWVVGIAIILIGWGAAVTARLVFIENTRFTNTDGTSMEAEFDIKLRDLRDELREYVDDEIRIRHPGGEG